MSANSHTGIAEIEENLEFCPTATVVLHLAKILPYSKYEFRLFLDNYFTKAKLFNHLQTLGIGACGAIRADVTSLLFGKQHETWKQL